MRKINKVLLLLLFACMIEIVSSCCDCESTANFRYKTAAIEVFNLDNGGPRTLIKDTGTIVKTAYGIRLNTTSAQTASSGKSFSFFGTCYASSCACPPEKQFLPTDSIIKIRVITLHTFDNTHAAETDIAAYFKVFSNNYLLLLPDYLSKPADVFYEELIHTRSHDLLLMTAPTVIGTHQFRVEVILSTGDTLSSTTKSIMLQ